MTIDRQEESKTAASDTHRASMERALAALQGLYCGDAFGECFFQAEHRAPTFRAGRTLPAAPWRFTDDTLMAISVCASLERHGGIDPQWLAGSFALHHDPDRGYGPAMNGLLLRLHALGADITGYALPPEGEESHFTQLGLDRMIRHIEGDGSLANAGRSYDRDQPLRPQPVHEIADNRGASNQARQSSR